MESKKDIQVKFNQALRERAGEGLVHAVCKALPLSSESVYRRLRDETAFSFNEVGTLANVFRISIDEMIHESDVGLTSAVYQSSYDQTGEIEDLVHPFSTDDDHESEVTMICKDLFVIHYLQMPVVFKYLRYFWKRVICNDNEMKGHSFNPALIEDLPSRETEKTVSNYHKRPVTEIWNIHTLDPLLHRIEYGYNMGLFNNAARLDAIFESIDSYLQKLELRLDTNISGDNRPFGFYICNLEPDVSIAFCEKEEEINTRLYLNPFNYLKIENRNVSGQLKERSLNLLNTGVNIYGQSDIQRYHFFHALRSKVNGVRERLAENRNSSSFIV